MDGWLIYYYITWLRIFGFWISSLSPPTPPLSPDSHCCLASLLYHFNPPLFFIHGLLPSPVTLCTNIWETSFSFPPAELKVWFLSNSPSIKLIRFPYHTFISLLQTIRCAAIWQSFSACFSGCVVPVVLQQDMCIFESTLWINLNVIKSCIMLLIVFVLVSCFIQFSLSSNRSVVLFQKS